MLRRHRAAAVLAGAVVLLVAACTAPAQAANGNATLTVFHGVPGATVDVYANGNELLTDFEPGTVTDPTELPAGPTRTRSPRRWTPAPSAPTWSWPAPTPWPSARRT